MRQLKLYNTLTQTKEILKPLEEGHVKMYTCGPTVYNYAHIGNFRTYMFEDLLRRTIKSFGFRLTHVMNITDVDDKTINGALNKKCTLEEFTKPYTKAFFEDIHTLKIEKAEHYPAATEYIPEMIEMIQTLLKKEIAYVGEDNSVYYSIKDFKEYGKLSHLHLDELLAGASERSQIDEYTKENVSDFVLWKACDPERDGDIFWESPWGKGRPGWHLECSAMALSILGHSIDIHCGGIDNMFPHHENEIAQSEACTGCAFSTLWLHAEHLVVDGKKMSKSLGNFYTLRDLLRLGYTGEQIRYMLLHTHYKTQLNFTLEGLDGCKTALKRLQDFIFRLKSVKNKGVQEELQSIHETTNKFFEALGDDLNISLALSALFDFVREANGLLDQEKIGQIQAETIIAMLQRMNAILGVLDFEEKELTIPKELTELLLQREQARKEKNWKLADELRDKISASGFVIEDGAHGPQLKAK